MAACSNYENGRDIESADITSANYITSAESYYNGYANSSVDYTASYDITTATPAAGSEAQSTVSRVTQTSAAPVVSRVPSPAPVPPSLSAAPPVSRAQTPAPAPVSRAPAPISRAPAPQSAAPVDNAATFEQEVLRLVNEHRARNSLPALQWDNRLGTAARNWSVAMHNSQRMAHYFNSRDEMIARFTNSGFPWVSLAENVARGQTAPQAVVTAWINSPGHNANMLNPNFTHIGVGYHLGDRDLRNWWTQKFAQIR